MVVDIGGGTTDIGVITMNGVAISSSIKVAGTQFDEVIIKYVRKRFGVIIGANTAEEIKLSIGCVSPRPASLTMTAARRVTDGFCQKAVELVLQPYVAMKTGADGPERLLELLLVQLSQEARHG